MATFTIKIDERNKSAKSFIDYIKTLPFVKIEKESHYNPEFVKMVKKAEASKKRYKVDNVDKLWESL